MRGWFGCHCPDHLTYFPNGPTFLTGDSRLAVSAAEGFFIVLGIVRGAQAPQQPPHGSIALALEAGWYAPHEHYRDDALAPDQLVFYRQ